MAGDGVGGEADVEELPRPPGRPAPMEWSPDRAQCTGGVGGDGELVCSRQG